MSEALLEIKDLTVKYITMDGVVHAVTDVDLSIGVGEYSEPAADPSGKD